MWPGDERLGGQDPTEGPQGTINQLLVGNTSSASSSVRRKVQSQTPVLRLKDGNVFPIPAVSGAFLDIEVTFLPAGDGPDDDEISEGAPKETEGKDFNGAALGEEVAPGEKAAVASSERQQQDHAKDEGDTASGSRRQSRRTPPSQSGLVLKSWQAEQGSAYVMYT